MTKVLVETTGDFMLVDAYNGDIIEATGCSVVGSTQFVQARIAAGQLTLHLGGLNDEATSEEWAAYLKESGNFNLAKAAFESAFRIGSQKEEPVGPSFEDIDAIVATSLMAEDFQKDGKPKVGALKAAGLSEMNVELRDAYWEWKQG